MKKDYRMPTPEVGEIVHYRYEAIDKPVAAVVVSVGARSVWLHYWSHDGGQRVADSVRYKSDPDLINHAVAKNGFWEFTPTAKKDYQIRRLWDTLLEVCGTDEAGLEEIITKKRQAIEEAEIDRKLAEDKKRIEAEKEAAAKQLETAKAKK